jgi:hypothetical protein
VPSTAQQPEAPEAPDASDAPDAPDAVEPSDRPHRVRNLVIDIAIVAVIGVHLIAFLAIRGSQARYTDEAADIATWAQSQGVSRIAWPDDLRAAVPTLLDAGVTPVLFDPPELNAQQLVINDTAVVVTRGEPDGLDGLTTAQHPSGSLEANLVDLDAAALRPLDVGQAVEVEYSRPYLYAPILDSHRLVVGEPLEIPVTLARGEYVFTTEVFDPDVLLALGLTAAADGGPPLAQVYELAPVVYEPQELRFAVTGSGPQPFVLKMEVFFTDGVGTSDENAADAILHRWSLDRTG